MQKCQPTGDRSQNGTWGGCLRSLEGDHTHSVQVGKVRLRVASALIRGFDKRSSGTFSRLGSVLSLGDLTVCGDTDGIHAITVPGGNCQKKTGTGLREHEGTPR